MPGPRARRQLQENDHEPHRDVPQVPRRACLLYTSLDLVVGVVPAQVVDVQGHLGVVDEALEEFHEQVDVEAADAGTGKGNVHLQAGPPGEVDDHPRQRLVEGHVGVAVAADALLVADGLGEGLAEGDADEMCIRDSPTTWRGLPASM